MQMYGRAPISLLAPPHRGGNPGNVNIVLQRNIRESHNSFKEKSFGGTYFSKELIGRPSVEHAA